MKITLPGDAPVGPVADTKDMNTKPNAFQADIDTQLADLYGQASKVRFYLDSARKSVASYTERFGAEHPNTLSSQAQVEKHTAALATIREQEKPLEAIYAKQPWSRFFLCNAHGGHIHSSLSCSTTFMTTEFSWLPELSGLTEAEAVEEYGAILCTVCFPSAPVEWTGGVNKKQQAEKDARQADRAAKAAAKAEKAITAPDGSPLKGKWGTIATLVTARRELTEALAEVSRWSEGNLLTNANHDSVVAENTAAAERIIEAIAAKTGEEPDTIRAEAKTKADNKRKKEGY